MTNSSLPALQIVLPVFNEEETIPKLLLRLDAVKEKLKDAAVVSYLFVNDGSSDGTRATLESLATKRTDLRLVNLLHNFGHTAAIVCGLDHFQGDICVVMDADLQDPPEVIPEMFEAWKRGEKTVVAERKSRREKTQLMFKTFYFFFHKFARTVPPISFGTHCLLDKTIVQRLRGLSEKNRYFPGLVAYGSGSIFPVQVDRHERKDGSSRVGYFGLVNLAVTAFISFSSTPIRLVSILGLTSATVGMTAGFVIVAVKLFTTQAIPGWASMMTVLSVGFGMQLLCLGIIGEYIARIYDEVKNRPLYYAEKESTR